MKNKIFTATLTAGFLLTAFAGIAQAAPKAKTKAEVAATQAAGEDLKQAIIDKTHQTLSARAWTIYVVPSDGRGSAETDVLTFADGKVTSRNLSAQGYPTSNYGVFIEDDGVSTHWETMQARELEVPGKEKVVDLAFLRGGLSSDGTEMAGTISVRPQRGARQNFTYSTRMSDLEKAPAAAVTPVAPTKKKAGR
jgi:hypothetical protein